MQLVIRLVCLSIRLSAFHFLTLTSFDRFISKLAHRLLRSRSPSLVIFSFQGQTSWGQDGVKGHMLSCGKFFIAYFYRGVKLDHFCSRDHRPNPYIGVPVVKNGYMLSCGQNCSIVYFDRGIRVYQLLSRNHRF